MTKFTYRLEIDEEDDQMGNIQQLIKFTYNLDENGGCDDQMRSIQAIN